MSFVLINNSQAVSAMKSRNVAKPSLRAVSLRIYTSAFSIFDMNIFLIQMSLKMQSIPKKIIQNSNRSQLTKSTSIQEAKRGNMQNQKKPMLNNTNTPLLPTHPLFPPLAIRRTIRLISRANTRPNTILRTMISRARRRRRQLHSLKLRIRDNPHPIQIPHQLEIRPTPRQPLPIPKMVFGDMIEHLIPRGGCIDSRLAVFVFRRRVRAVDERCICAHWTSRCRRRRM